MAALRCAHKHGGVACDGQIFGSRENLEDHLSTELRINPEKIVLDHDVLQLPGKVAVIVLAKNIYSRADIIDLVVPYHDIANCRPGICGRVRATFRPHGENEGKTALCSRP